METNNTEREFFTLVDEEGVEREFELIGAAELNGNQYYASTFFSASCRNTRDWHFP